MILPPLNTLQAFEATARLQSMSKAGAELNITHAAISGQIKRLEDWLGRRLFERVGRGVVLTPVGQEFLAAVTAGLAGISASAQGLRQRRDRGKLIVGCQASVASRWLVPALPDFIARHPGIDLQVTYALPLERFDPEKYDVMITHQAARSEAFSATRLFSRINKPVASPAYLARSGVGPALTGAHLLHDETPEAWEDWFRAAGHRPEHLTHGPVYQDFNLLGTAVIAGHGVALCPVELVRREIAAGDLVVLSEVGTLADEGYFILSDRESNRTVRLFTRWLVETCGRAG